MPFGVGEGQNRPPSRRRPSPISLPVFVALGTRHARPDPPGSFVLISPPSALHEVKQ